MQGFKIKVYGRVQGVGFRYYTKVKADELHVFGTVQNLADGTVIILCYSYSTDSMSKFIHWLHKGPDSAFVDRLEYEEIEIAGGEEFQIKR